MSGQDPMVAFLSCNLRLCYGTQRHLVPTSTAFEFRIKYFKFWLVTLSNFTFMHLRIFFRGMGNIRLTWQGGLLVKTQHFLLPVIRYLFVSLPPNANSSKAATLLCHHCWLLPGNNSFWIDDWANGWPGPEMQQLPSKSLFSCTSPSACPFCPPIHFCCYITSSKWQFIWKHAVNAKQCTNTGW